MYRKGGNGTSRVKKTKTFGKRSIRTSFSGKARTKLDFLKTWNTMPFRVPVPTRSQSDIPKHYDCSSEIEADDDSVSCIFRQISSKVFKYYDVLYLGQFEYAYNCFVFSRREYRIV